jgi:hypothetical protein
MACARDINYQNPNGTQAITKLNNSLKCLLRNKRSYPSFAPQINNLSITQSSQGLYTLVYINGTNFFPQCYGSTFVNFGQYTNLPITFYSSFNISFVVPLNATIGSYNVRVVNIYNSNFSPAINQTYPGKPNYSNSITYNIS